MSSTYYIQAALGIIMPNLQAKIRDVGETRTALTAAAVSCRTSSAVSVDRPQRGSDEGVGDARGSVLDSRQDIGLEFSLL